MLVVHDQTRIEWQAGRAKIRNGRIVVLAGRADPPAGLFDTPAATYSIRALDGANRSRCYPHLILCGDSRPPKEYVFD